MQASRTSERALHADGELHTELFAAVGVRVAGGGGGVADRPVAKPNDATRFYARFELDTVRGVKQFGEILEHVTRRLGSKVKLTLEVEADNPGGFDDTTRRIVSENATNLGATAAEFE